MAALIDLNKLTTTNGTLVGISYNTLVVPRRSKIWIIVPNNEYWIQCVKEII